MTIDRHGDAALLQVGNEMQRVAISNPHPEVSFHSLWQKVWYEGYAEPIFSWQSSSADDDFEPKFSLTPLAFGTLKGAFYALLKLQSSLSSDQAMERLIRGHQVALVSGSSFGLEGCWLRLSYGMLGEADLAEALQRLVRGLQELALG